MPPEDNKQFSLFPDYANKFVITGGPGFGKTSLLKELEQNGYKVFHEAARAMIEEQENLDNPILPWTNRIEFDHKLIQRMLVDYQKSDPNSYNFYDRGFPDLIGWRRYAQLETKDIEKTVYFYPYEKLVFLTQPWEEIYERNEHRPYSFDEASRINHFLELGYSNLGYIIEYLPKINVKRRFQFVVQKISKFKNYKLE
jgi:predicted ATPase